MYWPLAELPQLAVDLRCGPMRRFTGSTLRDRKLLISNPTTFVYTQAIEAWLELSRLLANKDSAEEPATRFQYPSSCPPV